MGGHQPCRINRVTQDGAQQTVSAWLGVIRQLQGAQDVLLTLLVLASPAGFCAECWQSMPKLRRRQSWHDTAMSGPCCAPVPPDHWHRHSPVFLLHYGLGSFRDWAARPRPQCGGAEVACACIVGAPAWTCSTRPPSWQADVALRHRGQRTSAGRVERSTCGCAGLLRSGLADTWGYSSAWLGHRRMDCGRDITAVDRGVP